jgi:hypothetical protein
MSFPDGRIPNFSPIVDGAITSSNTFVQTDVGHETTSVPVVEGVPAALFRWSNLNRKYGQIDLNLEVCISNIMCTGQ